MSWTNRGVRLMMGVFLRGEAPPTNFYLALCTDAVTPTVDINTLSELAEIAAGNGYTSGGYLLNRNSTDFDTIIENDTDDRGEVQIKDVTWTGSGGEIPASGGGARWAVLTTDEGTVGNRQVLCWWDLVSARIVVDAQPLILQNLEFRGAPV